MTSARPIRAQLLDLARLALESIQGGRSEPIEITLTCAGISVHLKSHPGELDRPQGPESLTSMARSLLEAATSQPQTPKALARKAGYRSLSHVYQALRELLEAGLLERLPDGAYRRA